MTQPQAVLPDVHDSRFAQFFVYLTALILFVSVFLALLGTVRDAHATPTSIAAPKPLAACADNGLQRGLERTLAGLGLSEAALDKRLAVAVVDITDPANPHFAGVNGDEMMYAASLPKIAILLGAFQRIEDGQMRLSDENRRLLTAMIRNSSNAAATTMLNRVGKDYLLELLQSPRYQLYDMQHGGLWVGKEYGKSPAFHRDPLKNLSHGATAFQVARFYYLLETGRLVSPTACQTMKQMLGNPGIHHKFVKGLQACAPDAQVFRKSGTWRDFHADSAIVEHAGRRYIVVGLAHSPQGAGWLVKLVQGVDALVLKTASQPS